MPTPGRKQSMMTAPFSDPRRGYRTEPVPPGANRFVADIDAAFVQQIFDLPQRKRIPDIHHHSQADDLGRRLEISEGIAHPETLRNRPHRLKPVSSDTAFSGSQVRYVMAFDFIGFRVPEAKTETRTVAEWRAESILDSKHAYGNEVDISFHALNNKGTRMGPRKG